MTPRRCCWSGVWPAASARHTTRSAQRRPSHLRAGWQRSVGGHSWAPLCHRPFAVSGHSPGVGAVRAASDRQRITVALTSRAAIAGNGRRGRHHRSGQQKRGIAMMPGMPDLGQLLQQAQQMQAEMERAQASLAESEVTGSAGSGLVTVVVNGSGDLLRLRIDPSVVDPADIETLEDLIVAAVHDARRSAEAIASTAMNSVAGSLDLSSM